MILILMTIFNYRIGKVLINTVEARGINLVLLRFLHILFWTNIQSLRILSNNMDIFPTARHDSQKRIIDLNLIAWNRL